MCAAVGDPKLVGPDYVAAGINLSIPLYEGGFNAARRREARYHAKVDDELVRDQEDNIARDVRITSLNVDYAWQRLGLTEELLRNADQALVLAQARLSNGSNSIVELSQAELKQDSWRKSAPPMPVILLLNATLGPGFPIGQAEVAEINCYLLRLSNRNQNHGVRCNPGLEFLVESAQYFCRQRSRTIRFPCKWRSGPQHRCRSHSSWPTFKKSNCLRAGPQGLWRKF